MRATTLLLALILSAGCAKHATLRDLNPRALTETLEGTWVDGTGARYQIVRFRAKEPVVTYVVGPGGEPFDVVGQSWVEDTFAFTYKVPTTGFLVTITVLGVEEDSITVRWSNDRGGSGTDALRPY